VAAAAGGVKSAPIPATVLAQYMITALVGILIYVRRQRGSAWKLSSSRSTRPGGRRQEVDPPLAAGAAAADRGIRDVPGVKPSIEAGAQLRSIHPAAAGSITFAASR